MARARWPWHGSPRRPATPSVDVDEVTELLEKVRQLRMTLTADLSAAAGALDAEQPDVARDILAADRVEVRRLTAPVTPPQPSVPPRRRRALIALPAIPLVGALAITGAAALTSNGSDHRASAERRSVVSAIDTPASIQQTATTTLQHLERVVAARHHPRRVVTLAAHLHDQLTALIATAPHDAVRLSEVQQLLSAEQQLLESHHGEGTAIALAASRHVNDLLAAAGIATTTPTSLPTVPAKPTKVATPSPTPTPTSTKSAKPHPSTTPTTVVSSPSAPSHSPIPTRHAHHHHRHLTNPLTGSSLLNDSL